MKYFSEMWIVENSLFAKYIYYKSSINIGINATHMSAAIQYIITHLYTRMCYKLLHVL